MFKFVLSLYLRMKMVIMSSRRSRMSHMRPILLRLGLVLAVVLTIPVPALAHARWFVSGSYPPHFELLFTPPVLLMIGFACLGVASLAVLHRLLSERKFFQRMSFPRYYDRSNRVILAIQTAISLIAVAIGLHLFAPNIAVNNPVINMLFAVAEIFIAVSFLTGLLTRIGALVLLVLFALSFFFFPAWEVLDQSIYAGIACYLLIMGRGMVKPGGVREPLAALSRYWRLAPILLRVVAGTSLVVVAFTEKLLNPQLTLAFLRMYPDFNVAHLMGMAWFSNEWFILAAGTVELTLGLCLISGFFPRLIVTAALVPFALALPFLPVTELLGHLPFFAVMYVLFFLPPPYMQKMDALLSYKNSLGRGDPSSSLKDVEKAASIEAQC